MNKKLLAASMAAVMAASVLSACGGGEKATASSSTNTAGTAESTQTADSAETTAAKTETKTISAGGKNIDVEVVDTDLTGTFTYWSAFSGDSATWDQWRVDAFNEAYKDKGIQCEVQFVPDGAGINNGKLLSSISGGTAPDVLITDNPTSAYQYVAEGCFMPLDSILSKIDLDTSKFFDGCKDVIYYKDQAYLIPQDTNVIMLYYNPDIAKECGLDPDSPPTTLDELNQWMDAETVVGADGTVQRFGLVPWLDSGNDAFVVPYIFGANIYDAASGKLDLTSPEMVTYMQWVQDFAQKYDPTKINNFTSGLGAMFSPDHPFMTGKVGMTITGNWFSEALATYAPNVNYKVCPVPVPAGGREKSTTFGCNVFAIPQGTDEKQAELASLFIKFCMQGCINNDNFCQWHSIPCIDSEFDNVTLTKDNDAMYALEREIANSPKNGVPALCSVSAELSTAFQTFRESVIYDDVDVTSGLKDLQDKYQAQMDAK
jgi:ABC-type glycerol-3-phosphate transport system substrate-binding protein